MSDELVWSESQLLGGANTHHAITQRNRYDIMEMKPRRSCGGSWHTARTDHALMPPFNGYCFTLESAKRACEHDFIALARADRWLDYMRDNEPPPSERATRPLRRAPHVGNHWQVPLLRITGGPRGSACRR